MIPYAPRTSSTMEPNRWKPNVELAPNCPRCDSSDTKFCYYNNYSLTQPRYFCKGCRRYWTKGGSLRNVPFGGGCRKNRRPKRVRPPNDPAAPGGDRSAYSRVPANSLRPDLMLDDMVGNSRAGGSTDSDGSSSIDLALLYAKFLNQCPGEDAVPFGIVGSSDSHQATAVQGPSEGASESPSSNENLVSAGGLSYWTDLSSNYASAAAAAAAAAGDISDVVSSLTWHEGFHPIPEDNVMLHQDLMTGDWSTLDQSTFHAF